MKILIGRFQLIFIVGWREREVFDGLVLSNRERLLEEESCVREVKILGELRNLVLNATSEDTYDYEEKI